MARSPRPSVNTHSHSGVGRTAEFEKGCLGPIPSKLRFRLDVECELTHLKEVKQQTGLWDERTLQLETENNNRHNYFGELFRDKNESRSDIVQVHTLNTMLAAPVLGLLTFLIFLISMNTKVKWTKTTRLPEVAVALLLSATRKSRKVSPHMFYRIAERPIKPCDIVFVRLTKSCVNASRRPNERCNGVASSSRSHSLNSGVIGVFIYNSINPGQVSDWLRSTLLWTLWALGTLVQINPKKP